MPLPAALLALAAAAQASAAPPPQSGLTKPSPADAQAVAAACGGEIYPADVPKLGKAAVMKKLACFTREAAARFNRTLPSQVDPATTLERVSADGATLTYHYKVSIARSELRPGALDAFKPKVREKVCAAADMKSIVAIGGAYRYLWIDRNGEAIGELLVDAC